MNDPVQQFLGTDFSAPAAPGLQQVVLARTTRVLRRRLLRRRLAWAAALAACFLAGAGTMLLWHTLEPPEQQARGLHPKEDLAANQEKPAAPSTKLEPLPSLAELEWRAFDSRDNRSALFFEVAQRYLEEARDYDSALRCYRQALDAAPREALAIRTDDNWLVMALKEARSKENSDASFNR